MSKQLVGSLSLSALIWANAAGAAALEEIVVTAQKKLEQLQTVPIAVTAVTEEQLKQSGVTSSYDLTKLAPGLNFGRSLGYASPFLRGVGTTNVTAGDEPSVATYVDGVYQGAMYTAALPFNNIAQIQVLKGPQGTLFGRNATGGLVDIVTKAPQNSFEANLSLSYSSFETSDANAYITGPLSDNINASLALRDAQQGRGYVHNYVTGNRIGEEDSQSVRVRFDIAVSDTTQVILSGDYAKADSTSTSTRIVYPGSVPLAALGGGRYSYGPYNTYNSMDPRFRIETGGGYAKVETELAFADFTSATAYRRSRALNSLEADGTSLDGVPAVIHPTLGVQAIPALSFATSQSDPYFVTQEFQLASNNDSDLEWISGLFFQKSRADYEPLALHIGVNLPPFATISSETKTEAAAAFGQLTYHLTDELTLTTGLRYSYERKEFDGDGTGAFAALHPSDEKSWNAPTWRVALDYQVTPDLLLYVVNSRGFKSGVFNSNSLTDYTPVDPEILTAYEAGFKFDVSDQLRVNSSIFYYNYRDLQLLQMVAAGTSALRNAAKAEIQGLDLEVVAAPVDGLILRGGLSLIDSEYADYKDAGVYVPAPPAGNALVSMDVSGNQLVRTPESTANLGIAYEFFLPDSSSLKFSVDYFNSSGFPWEPGGRVKQSSYDTVDAQIGWRSRDDRWGVTAFGKNLTDEVYGAYGSTSNRIDTIAYAPPRTGGVRIDYSWK